MPKISDALREKREGARARKAHLLSRLVKKREEMKAISEAIGNGAKQMSSSSNMAKERWGKGSQSKGMSFEEELSATQDMVDALEEQIRMIDYELEDMEKLFA